MLSATIAVLGARPLVRRGLEVLLRAGEGYAVAPGYACVKEVHARDEHVDVLVVDLDAAMLSDLAGAGPLAVSHVVGVHDRRDRALLPGGEAWGIHSLVVYEDEPGTLLQAIEGRLGDSRGVTAPPPRPRPQPSVLTERETEVLRLIADGLTTRDVSNCLGISPRTVENYKQHMFAKLGVQSRAHAVAVGSRMGNLGPLPARPRRGESASGRAPDTTIADA
jgi:DNA-binding NarL/FixJ family response regulator